MRISHKDSLELFKGRGIPTAQLTVLVFLDGELVGSVAAFDTDEGWVEVVDDRGVTTRKTGVVSAKFRDLYEATISEQNKATTH